MFLQNYDWPGNNVKFWRPVNGRLKFIFFDLDAGLTDPFYNMFQHCSENDEIITWPNPPIATYLFRELIKNPLFVDDLFQRIQQLLNECFLVDKMIEKVVNTKSMLNSSINKHIIRWGLPYSYGAWEEDINEIISFLELRPCLFAVHSANFLDCDNLSIDWANSFCDNFDLLPDIMVFPNPNNGIFSIKNKEDKNTHGRLLITNINGVVIYNDFEFDFESSKEAFFDFSHLPNGLYLVNFTNSYTQTFTKFIVANN